MFRPSAFSEKSVRKRLVSEEGETFPMSADMSREHPIAEVQSSSAQARGIGATGLGDGDGEGIETGIL
jgi:hypothetical protein